jgi:RHS repeat-associated protein
MTLTDAAGNVVETYSDDPYGNTTITGPVPNPYRYAGALIDNSSGLYKMGARYYDPSIGRFTQTDPGACSQTADLYWYADDDPVNESDPTGLCFHIGPRGQCMDRGLRQMSCNDCLALEEVEYDIFIHLGIGMGCAFITAGIGLMMGGVRDWVNCSPG